MSQIYNACIPLVKAGNTVDIKVEQSLDLPFNVEAPNVVKVKIEGPQLILTPEDIAGVYPAPGSEESPDEFLPHVALKRRTLPWERIGPGPLPPSPNMPWVALLLFKESELRTAEQRKLSPDVFVKPVTVDGLQNIDNATRLHLKNTLLLAGDTAIRVLVVANSILKKVLPRVGELPLLCTMKRATAPPSDNSIVISNRLPLAEGEKPEMHIAALVSLERRKDIFNLPAAGSTALIVLHHWTFRPSKGGDFEQVMKSVAVRPNGGVMRFGNLPNPAGPGQAEPLSGGFQGLMDTKGYLLDPLEHDQEGNVIFRGPLRPFKPPPRSKNFAISSEPDEFQGAGPGEPRDYSHATAFELGRLLAMADPGILEDLRDVRAVIDTIEVPAKSNPLPPALQKPDWVVNPAWDVQPWDLASGLNQSLVKDQNLFEGKGIGDVGGILDHLGTWNVGDIVTQVGNLGVPAVDVVTQVDIANVNAATLDQQFANVKHAAKF